MIVWLAALCVMQQSFPSPERAAARMTLPEGFRVQLVAGEPTLIKPIAMTTDERGRLWVVESRSYPRWITDGKPGKDRVLIFEEKPAGGYSCKVFLDNGTNLSGIAVGFGGVYLCSAPNLIHIPLDPEKDRPAGKARVLLDGWSLKAQHNVFNGLNWGPDGWLYGLNGITDTSYVGKPGAAKKDRTALNCGVWRYHPTEHRFDVVAWGTTNPWGMDWNDHGELFITNCVIKHLFHVVPGAHFVRMFGQDLNPHTYGLLESCADHIHWGGGHWTQSRGGKKEHSDAGGGHAHAGALFYLGDNWPPEYRDRIFMANIHGNRINQDRLQPRGSTYVARHCKDFLMANDPWFRGLALTMAPDGGVFISDWHDTGECHNYKETHPSGRIYKVVFGKPKQARPDLSKATDLELVKLQLHKNDWWVRQARRVIQERAAAKKFSAAGVRELQKIVDTNKDVTRRLRALWALHACHESYYRLEALLKDPDEPVRVWMVRLLVADDGLKWENEGRLLLQRARAERSPAARLALASAAHAYPRWGLQIIGALASGADDASDPYLPLMLWYGVEKAAAESPKGAVTVLREAKAPLLRRNIARRIATLKDGLPALVAALSTARDEAVLRDALTGMGEALAGRRKLATPERWADARKNIAASKDAEVWRRGMQLSVIFGDREALVALQARALDAKAAPSQREFALGVLLDADAPAYTGLLGKLLDDPAMRGPAIRGLARFAGPGTPRRVLALYPKLTPAQKEEAVGTLSSRPAYALALLDAIETKKVPRSDVSTYWARQMLALNDARVKERLASVWGSIRPPGKERAALLKKYIRLTDKAHRDRANPSNGRALFARTCAGCHKLFGQGGAIGPELTGSQRHKPEYLLTKLLDPNASVPNDYQVSRVQTVSGRVLTGVVLQEAEASLVLQLPTEQVRIQKADIEKREKLKMSLMPEGMLQSMKEQEVRDLLAYLASPTQVPLPKSLKKE